MLRRSERIKKSNIEASNDVEEKKPSSGKRGRPKISAIAGSTDQQRMSNLIGSMASPTYKSGRGDQTPTGDGEQTSRARDQQAEPSLESSTDDSGRHSPSVIWMSQYVEKLSLRDFGPQYPILNQVLLRVRALGDIHRDTPFLMRCGYVVGAELSPREKAAFNQQAEQCEQEGISIASQEAGPSSLAVPEAQYSMNNMWGLSLNPTGYHETVVPPDNSWYQDIGPQPEAWERQLEGQAGLSSLRGSEARYSMLYRVMRDAETLASAYASEPVKLYQYAISQLPPGDRKVFEQEMKQYNQVRGAKTFAENFMADSSNQPAERVYRFAIKKYLESEDRPENTMLYQVQCEADALIAQNPDLTAERVYALTFEKFLI